MNNKKKQCYYYHIVSLISNFKIFEISFFFKNFHHLFISFTVQVLIYIKIFKKFFYYKEDLYYYYYY